MSEEWLMALCVTALGLSLVNTLTLIANNLGLASRIEDWREAQKAQHTILLATLQDILQRVERVERLERGEPVWEAERVPTKEEGSDG